jgi:hypothetical protein
MPASIIRKFRGLYDTGKFMPDPQGLAPLFPCIRPRADNRVRYTTAECVIRDKGTLDHFIDRVPKQKMQHVPYPDPNDDPILQCPEIDFEFVELDIEGIEVMSATKLVDVLEAVCS